MTFSRTKSWSHTFSIFMCPWSVSPFVITVFPFGIEVHDGMIIFPRARFISELVECEIGTKVINYFSLRFYSWC